MSWWSPRTGSSPAQFRRTRRRRLRRRPTQRPTWPSFSLLSGQDRFDDADRVEAGALRGERRVTARACVENEEADLVLGYVNRVFEANAIALARQLLRRRACAALTAGALPCQAASEVGLDEVARHASTLRSARSRGNVRTSELSRLPRVVGRELPGELGPGANAELRVDGGQMAGDRPLPEKQGGRDLAICPACGHEGRDAPLRGRQ